MMFMYLLVSSVMRSVYGVCSEEERPVVRFKYEHALSAAAVMIAVYECPKVMAAVTSTQFLRSVPTGAAGFVGLS